jgi:uncharacterized membrane protein
MRHFSSLSAVWVVALIFIFSSSGAFADAPPANQTQIEAALENIGALERPGQQGLATIFDGNKYIQCRRMTDHALRCEAAGALLQPSLSHAGRIAGDQISDRPRQCLRDTNDRRNPTLAGQPESRRFRYIPDRDRLHSMRPADFAARHSLRGPISRFLAGFGECPHPGARRALACGWLRRSGPWAELLAKLSAAGFRRRHDRARIDEHPLRVYGYAGSPKLEVLTEKGHS